MLARKSQRIARRTLTEEDRWRDLEVALKDDCVEALRTKMEFHEIDVHMTYEFDMDRYWTSSSSSLMTANRSALSLAVIHGAVKCVAYLKEMGARSLDRLGSHYDLFDLHGDCLGYDALEEELVELQVEEAKERWANFASTKFGLAKSAVNEIYHDCYGLFEWDAPGEGTGYGSGWVTVVSAYDGTIINGEDISGWHERLDSHDYCVATHYMYLKAEFNTLQIATFKYGRDALITRLVRDERKEIAKSYKLGFAALRYYADSQRASLLLAKNDGRLWLILTGLAKVNIPPELREKIVDFAFFGKNAPERKANKEESESESEEEEESESE